MKIAAEFTLILKMAYRTSARRTRRSIVVAATATIGMFSVVGSQGFINGFLDELMLVSVETGLGHVQIRPLGYLDSRQADLRLENAKEIEQRFRAVLPSSVRYARRIEREAMLRIGGDARGVLVVGIDPQKEGGVSSMPQWVMDGTFFAQPAEALPPSGSVPCLIGRKTAMRLDLRPGDWVVLSTGGTDGTVKAFRCDVTGIFHAPAAALDERLVIMKAADLSRIHNDGPEDEVSYFVFHGTSLADAPAIKSLLASAIGPGTEIATLSELEPSIAELVKIYDQITVLFYFLILGGFGLVLFESVTMSIYERQHEIGIMHAIGSAPRFLFWLVITEAFLLTLAGAVTGLGLGALCVLTLHTVGVDFGSLTLSSQALSGGIGQVRPYLTWKDPVIGLSIAITVGFLSGLFPAWRAVHISPIQAIYER